MSGVLRTRRLGNEAAAATPLEVFMHRPFGKYCALLLGAVYFAAAHSASASAETWSIREGPCSDWVGRWTVTEATNGVWTGTVDQQHVGGTCIQGTGIVLTGLVTASIANGAFSAQKSAMSDNNDCAYSGAALGTQILGSLVCDRITGPSQFNIER